MTKLNRKHGIEVGSKVKVISAEGSSAYNSRVGQILTVTAVKVEWEDEVDLIECDNIGSSQYPSRYELVKFTKADMKPFMRAVLRSGETTIVSADDSGALALTYEIGSWVDIQFPGDDSDYPSYDIVAVYEAPAHYNAVNFKSKGRKVFEEDVKAVARNAAVAAVADAEKALADARAKLEAI